MTIVTIHSDFGAQDLGLLYLSLLLLEPDAMISFLNVEF